MALLPLEDRNSLFYVDSGVGRPLLLLHGWGGDGEFFEKQLTLAGRGLRVIVPDLRGHGRSRFVINEPTIKTLARDVRLLLERLEIRDVILAGWSMGAMVAFEYLKQFGRDRIGAVVSIDMTAKITTDESWSHGVGGNYPSEDVERTCNAITQNWETFIDRTVSNLFATSFTPDDTLRKDLRTRMIRNNSRTLAHLWKDMAKQDYRSLLQRTSVKLTFIHGAESRIYSPSTRLAMQQLAPNAAAIEIPCAGHTPHWENADAFNAALLIAVNASS